MMWWLCFYIYNSRAMVRGSWFGSYSLPHWSGWESSQSLVGSSCFTQQIGPCLLATGSAVWGVNLFSGFSTGFTACSLNDEAIHRWWCFPTQITNHAVKNEKIKRWHMQERMLSKLPNQEDKCIPLLAYK